MRNIRKKMKRTRKQRIIYKIKYTIVTMIVYSVIISMSWFAMLGFVLTSQLFTNDFTGLRMFGKELVLAEKIEQDM